MAVLPSQQSTWWWNRKGFAWGAQEMLHHVADRLNHEDVERLQRWIHDELRDWVEAPDNSELGLVAEPPAFPTLSDLNAEDAHLTNKKPAA